MSDFDDEPVEGQGPAEVPADDEIEGEGRRGRRAAKGAARDDWDDDWDDEDDWDDRRPAGGRRDLTLVFGLIAAVLLVVLVVVITKKDSGSSDGSTTGATPGASGSTTVPQGFCGDWPASFGGDGKNVAKAEGVYVWSDFDGIHVRANQAKAVEVKVTGNTDFKVKDAGDGTTASATSGKEITLSLPAGKGASGPDLDVPCETTSLGFEVTQGGARVPAASIKVGGDATAEANPVQFAREPK